MRILKLKRIASGRGIIMRYRRVARQKLAVNRAAATIEASQ